jgi:anti-sigma regulatory factor (Ser/Thr protein kinase)
MSTNSQDVTVIRDLSGELTDASMCRRLARQELGEHVGNAALDDIVLVVSELVTNAVMHAVAPLVFRLSLVDAHVVVAIDDAGVNRDFEAVRRGPGAASGRGLSIVDQLADEWGIEASHAGKRVWARFDLDTESPFENSAASRASGAGTFRESRRGKSTAWHADG